MLEVLQVLLLIHISLNLERSLTSTTLRIYQIISSTLMKRDCQLNICHRPPRIVTGSQYKAQAITGGKSKTTSVIGGGNGVEQQVPVFYFSWQEDARRTAWRSFCWCLWNSVWVRLVKHRDFQPEYIGASDQYLPAAQHAVKTHTTSTLWWS